MPDNKLVKYVGYEDTMGEDVARWLSNKRWSSKTPEERSQFARDRANDQWRKRRAQKRIAEIIASCLR
jgi:hypothetical protein